MTRIKDLRTKAKVTAAYLKGRKETRTYTPTSGKVMRGWYLTQDSGYSLDYTYSGGRELGECWGGKNLFLGEDGNLYLHNWDREEWSGVARLTAKTSRRIAFRSPMTRHCVTS